jgi:quercetin dioxygenase-like cupin family protein
MQELVPIVRNEGEGDRQRFAGGGLHRWMLRAEETGGAFFLFEDTMVKDKTTPLHLHPEAHELTYVVDGEIEVQVDGQRGRVRSGGVAFVPKGVAHAFIVVSAEARLLAIQTPGAPGEAFYRGASDPASGATTDLVDLARLRAAAAQHPRGITILGPPPFAPAPTAAR